MSEDKIFNVLIIGAGPIGLACGIESLRNDLEYIIIEKGSLVNSIFKYPTNMTFFSTAEKIEIGNVPFVSHGDKPTRREALEYYRRVKEAFDLNVRTYEKVIRIRPEEDLYNVITDKGNYKTRDVIVATGYFDNPNLLNVPGEELSKVKHYFDEPHPYAFHKTAVIGAGNSAADVALELYRVGADVTMIIRDDKIKPSIKYWVKPDIENRIKENSIKAFFCSEVISISEKDITIKTPEGNRTIENDFVFAMTGYHPDHEFMKSLGIVLDGNCTPVYDRSSLETNLKGIYVAGVVCSGPDTDKFFIENSIEHSKTIIGRIRENLRLKTPLIATT